MKYCPHISDRTIAITNNIPDYIQRQKGHPSVWHLPWPSIISPNTPTLTTTSRLSSSEHQPFGIMPFSSLRNLSAHKVLKNHSQWFQSTHEGQRDTVAASRQKSIKDI